jgi:diaminopimelate epimerase
MRRDFIKMHGAGNDFVIFDGLSAALELTPTQVALLCDRHFGVGADGVIIARLSRFDDCAAYMHYINADGSLAEMCGNGVRCFAKFLVDGGHVASGFDKGSGGVDGGEASLGDGAGEARSGGAAGVGTRGVGTGEEGEGSFIVETLAGKRRIDYRVDARGKLSEATVDMGVPRFAPAQIPTMLMGATLTGTAAEVARGSEAALATEAGAVTSTTLAPAVQEQPAATLKQLAPEQPVALAATPPVAPEQSVAVLEQPIPTPYGSFAVTCVNMGNPHAVIFAECFAANPEGFALDEVGAWIERCTELFPQKINVEFAAVTAPDQITARVYERGVGETLACGTGACATAVAACLTGRCGREADVILPGGLLHICWRAWDGHVLMRGPAATVYEGTIEL